MLQQKQYVPLLHTGVAEMSAYRSLYPNVKNATFPIFQSRPWPHAKHFQLTVDKILEAVAGQQFALGLDAERHGYDNRRSAQQEFNELFNPHRGFQAYYDLVESISNAVPVLIPTTSADALLLQLGNADVLDRGLVIHQRRNAQIPLSDMILKLPPLPNDTVIAIDAGWSRDYLSLEAWALPLIQRVSAALPEAEIVVMSSSFPSSFGHIVGNHEEHGMERRLFSAIRQRFNSANLTYGDWGSTRPSVRRKGGGPIPSRVDIPKISSWEIFRADPNNDLGFCEMAWAAQHHQCFADVPDCWGKQMVQSSDDEGNGIKSRQSAAESRINIHMTIQSGAASIIPTDEVPYRD